MERAVIHQPVRFSTFKTAYEAKLREICCDQSNIDQLSLRRGIPPQILHDIWNCAPLSVFIPLEHGGRGAHMHECLSILDASAYEWLALSLTIGINGALFLQPVAKFGHETAKNGVFPRFVEKQSLGGLMLTEPDHGSDALRIRTSFIEQDACYRLQGIKHWSGLTGWADFWLIAARQQRKNDALARDIDLFICDTTGPNQEIVVEELYENLGLYMIPYGRNRVNVQVPLNYRLIPNTTGIQMLVEVLHRSRFVFSGMGVGFLRRILDEAITHCRERYVGGKSLLSYDHVQHQIARLEAFHVIGSAMCVYASEHGGIDGNLEGAGITANTIKAVITDYMQEASQVLLQLNGAKGYRLNHIAGRSVVDSRPFQIFEGPNEILYQQVAETIIKRMVNSQTTHLKSFLLTYEHTSEAVQYVDEIVDFDIQQQASQQKLVTLGRMLARIICIGLVVELMKRGLLANVGERAIRMLHNEVLNLLGSYKHSEYCFVDNGNDSGVTWLHYVNQHCNEDKTEYPFRG